MASTPPLPHRGPTQNPYPYPPPQQQPPPGQQPIPQQSPQPHPDALHAELAWLRQEDQRLTGMLKDFERKLKVEQQLKASAVAMVSLHTDKKNRKKAEAEVDVADNTLRSLNSQHQAIAAQHHQIFSRLQTLEAGNPSLKLEAPPSPQPDPSSPDNRPRAPSYQDYQKNTFELYKAPKRASATVSSYGRTEQSRVDQYGPGNPPTSPGHGAMGLLNRFVPNMARANGSTTSLVSQPPSSPQFTQSAGHLGPPPQMQPPMPQSQSQPHLLPQQPQQSHQHQQPQQPQQQQNPYAPYPSSQRQSYQPPPQSQPFQPTSQLQSYQAPPPQPYPPHPQMPPYMGMANAGPHSQREQEYLQQLRQQAEDIQKKDAEILQMSALLDDVANHLQTQPAAPQNETTSELAKQLIVVTQQKEALENRLAEAQRELEHKRERDSDSTSLVEGQLASLRLDVEEKNKNISRLESEIDLLMDHGGSSSRSVPFDNSKLEELTARNEALELEKANLEGRVMFVESQHMNARREQAEFAQRNAFLEDQLRQSGSLQRNKVVGEWQAKAESLEKQLADLRAHCAQLEAQAGTSQSNADQIQRDQMKLLEEKLNSLEANRIATKESSDKKRNILNAALEEAQAKLAVSTGQIESLTMALSQSQTEIEARDRELVHLRTRPTLEHVNKSASESAEQLKALSSQLDDALNRLGAAESKCSILENQLTEERAGHDQTSRGLSSALDARQKEHEYVLAKLQADLDIARTEVESIKAEMQQCIQQGDAEKTEKQGLLEKEVAKRIELETQLRNLAAERAEEVDALKRDIQDSQNACTTLGEKLSDAANTVARLEAEIAQGKQAAMDGEAKLVALEAAKADLEAKVVELEKSVAELQSQTLALQEGRKEVEGELAAAIAHGSRVESLEAQIADQNVKIETLSASLSQAESTATNVSHEKSALQQQLESLTVEVDSLRSQSQELKSERSRASELERELRRTSEDLQSALAARATLEKDLTAARASGGDAARLAEESRAREIESFRNDAETARVRIRQLEDTEARLAGVIEELESASAAAKDARVKECEREEAEKESTRSALVRLEQRVAELESERDALARSGEQKAQDVGAQLKALEQRVAELQSERDALASSGQQKLHDSETQLARVEAGKKEAERQLSILNDRITDLERSRAESEQARTSQISSLRLELQKLTTANETLRTEKSEESQRSQHRIHELESQLSQLEQAQQAEPATPPSTSPPSPSAPTVPPPGDDELNTLIAKNMELTMDLADREREVQELRGKIRRDAEAAAAAAAAGATEKKGWW